LRYRERTEDTGIVPRLIRLLPCLGCQKNERALEEIAAVYLATLHGERPPLPDGQKFRFLPKACCKQTRMIDPESLVA
jgi:ADP-ribose pyrophosphatase YjhB (NUDIX family)